MLHRHLVWLVITLLGRGLESDYPRQGVSERKDEEFGVYGIESVITRWY